MTTTPMQRAYKSMTGQTGMANLAKTSTDLVSNFSNPKHVGLGLAGLGALFLVPPALKYGQRRAERELRKYSV